MLWLQPSLSAVLFGVPFAILCYVQAHLLGAGAGDAGSMNAAATAGAPALLPASPSFSKLKSAGAASRPFSSLSHSSGTGSRPKSALFGPNNGLSMPARAASAMSAGRATSAASTHPAAAMRSMSAMSMRGAADDVNAAGGAAIGGEQEDRYKKMILKQQKLLEDATKKYRSLRTQYTNEIAARTELQNFLKKCIGKHHSFARCCVLHCVACAVLRQLHSSADGCLHIYRRCA